MCFILLSNIFLRTKNRLMGVLTFASNGGKKSLFHTRKLTARIWTILWYLYQVWNLNPIVIDFAILKVRQIRNDFFKLTFLPKKERTNSTCFCSFFGRKWRHQKNISKLTDLSTLVWNITKVWILRTCYIRVSKISFYG